jgi:hypothetical protein
VLIFNEELVLAVILFFLGIPTKSCKKSPIGKDLFVCLSAFDNSRIAEGIFMKFYIGDFYENFLTHSSFGENWTVVMGTLHEDLETFFMQK